MSSIQTAQQSAPASIVAGEKRYRYSLGIIQYMACLLFFGVGGLFMVYESATNTRGLVIDGILHFSPYGASNVYLLTAAVCFAFVGYATASVFISRTITLSAEAITLPGGGLDKSHYRITPNQILSARLSVYRGRHFVKVTTAERTYRINSAWLEDLDALSEIVRWLKTNTQRRFF